MMKKILILLLLGLSSLAFAKRFTNQYCEFELPPGWECALEGTEWVCQSVNEERRKEAIIILAAKIRGKQDSLDQYQGYLKGTKAFTLPGGKKQVSEPKYTKKTAINGQQWIDSLHMASEVPGFYTRYLATVKEDLGVAVTFSVAKDHYNSYKDVFDRVAATLRVFRQRNIKPTDFAQIKDENENLFGEGPIVPQGIDTNIDARQKKGKAGKSDAMTDYMIYALLAAAVAFFIVKAKGKKKKKKKKKKS